MRTTGRSLFAALASLTLAAALAGGCETPADDGPGMSGTMTPAGGSAVPQDVKAIVFLQRVARNQGTGNVFDYTSYQPGARLVKLEPPGPSGTLTTITNDPMFANADIMSWDLSFDARTVVISARNADHYQLFVMDIDGKNARQITDGPYDHVYPIFLPGQRILFTTNKSVEDGSPQFQDEYERQTTAQVGTIAVDGTGELLGARNVSHRVAPALMPDGSVLYTEWRHLGNVNDGQLRFMNTDMTGMREAFGGEGKGITNSYLKARWVDTTKHTDGSRDTYRIVTIGTSRDNTLQAGKLLLVDLNGAERLAEVKDLTPLVPRDRVPSANGVGRYYDAEVLGNPKDNKFLVSWADGPVETRLLSQAKTDANFGIYVFQDDGMGGKRYPVYDDPKMWDVMARPLQPRQEPPATQSATATGPDGEHSLIVGALNVYETTFGAQFPDLKPGSAVKVRLLEGFSGEEGFGEMFGLTEFDGQSLYGEVPVYADGSFAAKVPANVPVHMQLIDKFAMSLASEDVWVSGRPGEQRFCGGCHEDRAKPTIIEPGSTQAVQRGPINLDTPRAERKSMDFSYGKIRGVPWNLAIQPILDAKCVSCHDGDANKPGNPTYTVTDMTKMTTQTFTFDLRATPIHLMVGERADYDYPASYVSLVGLTMEFGEDVIEVMGPNGATSVQGYIEAGSAHGSELIKRLNPPQRFPSVDTTVRAFAGGGIHPKDMGGMELTPDEYYRLILNIDMGAQYFFRENRDSAMPYPMP